MALSRYAGVCYDRDLFQTLDLNIMRSCVAIMLNFVNIKWSYICQNCGYVKGLLNEER